MSCVLRGSYIEDHRRIACPVQHRGHKQNESRTNKLVNVLRVSGNIFQLLLCYWNLKLMVILNNQHFNIYFRHLSFLHF